MYIDRDELKTLLFRSRPPEWATNRQLIIVAAHIFIAIHKSKKLRGDYPVVRQDLNPTGKVKLSLCFFQLSTTPWTCIGEWGYSSIHSLTSALDGGKWSASRPGRFTHGERAPGTLETLTVTKQVKKFPFYGIQRFIVAFTRVSHYWSLF
jgi:hypothetical protein